jgi:GTP cyclohydrolase I
MNLDEVYTVGPIAVRSACSHHLVPIVGQAWIAVKPSDRVIGLSKFNRLVEWVMSRPQIQEEATVMLADCIEQLIEPQGLAVIIKAQHLCMSWRGVRDLGTTMTTSVMRGIFLDVPSARAEVLTLLGGQGL